MEKSQKRKKTCSNVTQTSPFFCLINTYKHFEAMSEH